MTMIQVSRVLVAAGAIAVLSADALAQTQPQTPTRGGGQGAGRRMGPRQGLPPVGPNMNMQEVQKWLDTWALIEAEKVLQLSQEQYPNFVSRLTRLHNVRRRVQMERRRMLAEISPLIQGPGPYQDDAIAEKLKALDEINQRGQDQIRTAYAAVDGILTPAQRGRFRLFEEQIERRKVDLLMKVRGR